MLRTLNVHHGEDDIALLVARVEGLAEESVGDWTLPPEPRSVARARELAREQLAAWQLDALGDTAELLVSELVTNALRYGEGDIRLRLMLDRTLVCEVWDAGQVQPRSRRAHDTDEGGRGLQLVDLLSSGWGSRRTPTREGRLVPDALPGGGRRRAGPDRGAAEPVLNGWACCERAAGAAARRASRASRTGPRPWVKLSSPPPPAPLCGPTPARSGRCASNTSGGPLRRTEDSGPTAGQDVISCPPCAAGAGAALQCRGDDLLAPLLLRAAGR